MDQNGYTILGIAASDRGEEPGPRTAPAPTPRSDAEARSIAVATLDDLVATPYIWGGKNPQKGLDCSGAVMVAYEKAGLARPGARYKYGSADLHKKLEPTTTPQKGDLAFYGSGKVNHVMLYAGDGKVIGATGGGRKTTSIDAANKAGAYVKYKPVNYRKDLLGFGRAPSVYATLEGSTSTKLDTSDSREDLTIKVGYGILASAFAALGAWGAWWLRNRK